MPGAYDHQWRRMRVGILERDGFRCQIRGPRCEVKANEVDHIVPVEAGGARLDPDNLRAACKPCNVGRANREKARNGWRRSSARIVLVVGPIGAGKSTYVQERATARDVVVDYDHISRALGPALPRGAGGGRHEVTAAARNAVLAKIRRGDVDAETVWIVSANPEAESIFPFHEVVVVDPGRDEVLRRGKGGGRPLSLLKYVDDWYARRGPPEGPSREWFSGGQRGGAGQDAGRA